MKYFIKYPEETYTDVYNGILRRKVVLTDKKKNTYRSKNN